MCLSYSGIGLALCERLLSEDEGQLRLCLACRNMQRAEAARAALLNSHPKAHVDLLRLDVGSVRSVLRAAQEVKSRYNVQKINLCPLPTHSAGLPSLLPNPIRIIVALLNWLYN